MRNMGSTYVFVLGALLLPSSRGNGLETYKWKDIVEDQIPNVSDRCEKEMRLHFNTSFLFEDLLYRYPDHMRSLCSIRVNSYLFSECTTKEKVSVFNFVCYRYNIYDTAIPPISKKCAMRYWYCSQIQHFFRKNLDSELRERICSLRDNSWKSYECWVRSQIDYPPFCGLDYDRLSTCVHSREQAGYFFEHNCYLPFPYCFRGDHFDVFQMFVKMKNFTDQPYLCGKLEECLVKSSEQQDGILCSRAEAVEADRFLCSNTSFTPDLYGVFLLPERCRLSFRQCYNQTSLTDLQTDPIKRKTICQSKLHVECLRHHLIPCSWKNKRIIHEYLCYSLNNAMLLVSQECYNSMNVWKYHDSAYAELPDSVKETSGFCNALSEINKFNQTPMPSYCTENEKQYVRNYFCPHLGCSVALKAKTFLVGLVFFVANKVS